MNTRHPQNRIHFPVVVKQPPSIRSVSSETPITAMHSEKGSLLKEIESIVKKHRVSIDYQSQQKQQNGNIAIRHSSNVSHIKQTATSENEAANVLLLNDHRNQNTQRLNTQQNDVNIKFNKNNSKWVSPILSRHNKELFQKMQLRIRSQNQYFQGPKIHNRPTHLWKSNTNNLIDPSSVTPSKNTFVHSALAMPTSGTYRQTTTSHHSRIRSFTNSSSNILTTFNTSSSSNCSRKNSQPSFDFLQQSGKILPSTATNSSTKDIYQQIQLPQEQQKQMLFELYFYQDEATTANNAAK